MKVMPLFDVGIDVDLESSNYILKLLIPNGRFFSDQQFSPFPEIREKCRRKVDEEIKGFHLQVEPLHKNIMKCQIGYYLDSIDTTLRELKFFLNAEKNEKWMQGIRKTLSSLFNISMESSPDSSLFMTGIPYQNKRVKQLTTFPVINWIALFSEITNSSIHEETVVQIYNWINFEKILGGIAQLNEGQLNDAFLAIMANILFEETVLTQHRHKRVEYCQKQSQDLMTDIVSHLYKPLVTEEMTRTNDNLKKNFKKFKKRFSNTLIKYNWISSDLENRIDREINKIKLVSFGKEYSNRTQLLSDYANLVLGQNDYAYNLYTLKIFKMTRLLCQQGNHVTPENMYQYFVDITKDQPVYFHTSKIVCIPYGLTKRAMKNLPEYFSLAQIGFPLAKVIGHAFVSTVIPSNISLKDLDNSTYWNYVKEMIAWFDDNPIFFKEKQLNFTIQNAISLRELIAENTALNILTDKFSSSYFKQAMVPDILKGYSKEKVFFITLGREFCRDSSLMGLITEIYENTVLPPEIAFRYMLGNDINFKEQFKCDTGLDTSVI